MNIASDVPLKSRESEPVEEDGNAHLIADLQRDLWENEIQDLTQGMGRFNGEEGKEGESGDGDLESEAAEQSEEVEVHEDEIDEDLEGALKNESEILAE